MVRQTDVLCIQSENYDLCMLFWSIFVIQSKREFQYLMDAELLSIVAVYINKEELMNQQSTP